MVLIGDDLATQIGPYMSLEMFRRLYKPYFAEYIASIRRHCPHAIIAHHCCGSSYRLLDDLAEIRCAGDQSGPDIGHRHGPGETRDEEAAPPSWAGLTCNKILPFGSPQEVDDFVRNLIENLAPGGGYILAACHSLPDDVKPENVITMLESALRWGTYPINAQKLLTVDTSRADVEDIR